MINMVAMAITGFCGVAVVGVSLKGPYDNLVRLAGLCDRAQADMQVQRKRRQDIAADLLELVRATPAHSNTFFEETCLAHTAVAAGNAAGEELDALEAQFGQALGKLIGELKNDPDMKADARVHEMVQELAQVEAMMVAIQTFYDKTFSAYETQRKSPVGKFFGLFGADGHKRDREVTVNPVLREEPVAVKS